MSVQNPTLAEIVAKAQELDKEYFGDIDLQRSIEVLKAQTASMEKNPAYANVFSQAGDLLFSVASMARNQGWTLEALLMNTIMKLTVRRDNRHYYEAHITIEPVFDERFDKFKTVCKPFRFHVAELLMQKRAADKEERSKNDSFCTGRSISFSDIKTRMMSLVETLHAEGFKVWRYKIESTLVDSRYDAHSILKEDDLPEKERNPKPPADGAHAGRG